MKQSYRFAIILSVIVLGLSCSNRETPIVEVESVTINTQKAEMIVGETIQLSAIVKPDNATDKKVTWKSNNESVVSVSSSGLVTANKEGNAVITALAGKCVSVCEISVIKEDVAVTSIELDKSSVNLAVGESTTLTATIKPENASVKTVTWVSSNSEVAQVEGDGKVTGINEGQTTVTANAGGKTAECKVTVTTNKVSVESIELDQSSVSLKVGESITLVATIKPENATDKTVTWASSIIDVAKVDENGVVSAISEGSTIITAKAGSKTALCDISVVSKTIEVSSVELDQTSVSIRVGETIALVATVRPENATERSIEWTSSNESIVKVDDNGRITGILQGNAIIYAKAGGKTATCSVTVVSDGFKPNGEYLSFTGLTANATISHNYKSLNLSSTTIEFSYDTIEWLSWASSSKIQLSTGTKIYVRGRDWPENIDFQFSLGGSVSAGGNLMSLFYYDDFKYRSSFDKPYSFIKTMFRGRRSLTTAPELPATTLFDLCYSQMFEGCTSLTKAPVLPAISLAESCYDHMFSGCTSLTTAPELPATSLAERCYYRMFSGCTSLTKAPDVLPATSLAQSCYSEMFNNCKSLAKAPELPARTLVTENSYSYMFSGCDRLSYVKMMAINILSYDILKYWLLNAAGNPEKEKIFIKNVAATWDDEQVIPNLSTWTVITATE